MNCIKKYIKKIFWNFPLFTDELKENIYYLIRRVLFNSQPPSIALGANDSGIYEQYAKQILSIPEASEKEYVPINQKPFQRTEKDPKIIAYYLPQFYSFKENDEWWGKGTTEWNNVSRAVPQYLGHYQPRLPGELGFYDLRLKDNIARQVELAKLYGIYAFCYYFYWFDGKRLLDKPLDLFLESKDIEFPFCLCWANENWTRRFDGNSGEVIMRQSGTEESYKDFISSVIPYLQDQRYMDIDGKKILVIYKPSLVPNSKHVIQFWRDFCRKSGIGEIYIIAVKESEYEKDLLELGYDAVSEFHPGTVLYACSNITSEKKFVQKSFYGQIFDYKDLVRNQRYFEYDTPKLYRSIMPMWDNTARRVNKGLIFDGANPDLYKQWLVDIIRDTRNRKDLDDSLIFVNAWNEWGEGAYLEPDRDHGYGFLQATRNAIEDTREEQKRI
ncbi:hypothetical protein Ga0466249_000119 [Sporomusaceae bacterium BoRhaA]|uniref:glycosyltransferase WbsX family protein n=1 Tax=Pelorhabdus rhamnosifermentans TaxID=2772457 RepID=UPI001C05FABE|nr:glycoside hydrolase family 99-like domain-containing protein [Pelorhabdus rhamnosifermentans]MBU2699040.1 hypothetical protein [Pelorhabdus rhamnosifermentans]